MQVWLQWLIIFKALIVIFDNCSLFQTYMK